MIDKEYSTLKYLGKRPKKIVLSAFRQVFSSSNLLQSLYERVGPNPPADLSATDYPYEHDPSCEARLFNYDMGHAGRFTLPSENHDGASISFDYVFSQASPEQYIEQHLLHKVSGHDWVIYSPGLNTIHQKYKDEMTSPKRLSHYCKVLQCIPLCQLHIGTAMDQPDICINATKYSALRLSLALSSKVIPSNDEIDGYIPTIDDKNNLIWPVRSVDIIQAGMSEYNMIDTNIKMAFRQLLIRCIRENTRPLTFVVYSRASMELLAALKLVIKTFLKRHRYTEEQLTQKLREKITIVTVGVACTGFPDGPAYIHVSSYGDKIVSLRGVSQQHPDKGGQDAIYLHCNAPYAKDVKDHHNFSAATSQLLSIAFAMNKVDSFRKLWELGQTNSIKLPEDRDLVVRAVLVLTVALNWLWDKEEALQDINEDEVFPSRDEAVEIVKDAVGEDYVNSLTSIFENDDPILKLKLL